MSKIEVSDYGDMLAQIKNATLIYYTEAGSYQGDYIAILEGREVEAYVGSYGSCSGCDWLEAEKDYSDDTVDYQNALEYVNSMGQPAIRLPLLTAKRMTGDEWRTILQDATKEASDFDSSFDFSDAIKAIKEHWAIEGEIV